MFARRLLRLPLCPLWGTWGLVPLSMYARAVETGTMRAYNIVWSSLLRNSSSGLIVAGPQRPFAWYLLGVSPPLPCVAIPS